MLNQKLLKIIPRICWLPEQQCYAMFTRPFFPHTHTKEKKWSGYVRLARTMIVTSELGHFSYSFFLQLKNWGFPQNFWVLCHWKRLRWDSYICHCKNLWYFFEYSMEAPSPIPSKLRCFLCPRCQQAIYWAIALLMVVPIAESWSLRLRVQWPGQCMHTHLTYGYWIDHVVIHNYAEYYSTQVHVSTE